MLIVCKYYLIEISELFQWRSGSLCDCCAEILVSILGPTKMLVYTYLRKSIVYKILLEGLKYIENSKTNTRRLLYKHLVRRIKMEIANTATASPRQLAVRNNYLFSVINYNICFYIVREPILYKL